MIYTLYTERVVYDVWEVEADSPQEAIKKFEEGEEGTDFYWTDSDDELGWADPKVVRVLDSKGEEVWPPRPEAEGGPGEEVK